MHTDDPVDLSESGETLQLLMKFMHQERYLDLLDWRVYEFKLLILPADSAENYMVHPAMLACSLRFADPNMVKFHGLRTLAYATKYDSPHVAYLAAPWCIDSDLKVVENTLGGLGNGNGVLTWLKFREQFIDALNTVFDPPLPSAFCAGHQTCGRWEHFRGAVLANLPRTPKERLQSVSVWKQPLDDIVRQYGFMLDGCGVEGCTIPVDIILRSSDDALIGAHKANLEQFSEGFPAVDAVTDTDGPVDLTENGETLRLLMQFMHKQKLPDLGGLTGSRVRLLFSLGEAAEKYFVYPAMAVCSVHISNHAMDDPNAVFCYAAKFGYPAMADAAACHTLNESLEGMEKRMAGYSHTIYAWLRYREQYLLIANTLLTEPPPYVNAKRQRHDCDGWAPYFKSIMDELPRTAPEIIASVVSKHIRIAGIFGRHSIEECSNNILCTRRVEAWKGECLELLERVQPFHTFLQ